MFTTLVCVMFVATPTSTISLYYLSMCTVCGHSYELAVLFVATTIFVSDNIVSVYSVYYSCYFSELYLPAPYSCVIQ